MQRLKILAMVMTMVFLLLGAFLAFFFSLQSKSALEDMVELTESDWRKNASTIQHVVFHLVENESMLLELLKKGRLDVAGPFLSLAYLEGSSSLADDNVSVRFFPSREFSALFFVSDSWPATERGLRRGLAFALNKSRFIEIALNPYKIPIDDPMIRSIAGWSSTNAEIIDWNVTTTCLPPDPIRGNLSLLLDGFYDIDGDGWREWYDSNHSGVNWEQLVNVSMFNPDVQNPSEVIVQESGMNPDAFLVFNLTIFNDLNNWKNASITIATPPWSSSMIKGINDILASALSSLGISSEIVRLPSPSTPVVPPDYHLIYIPNLPGADERTFIQAITQSLKDFFHWRNESFYSITSAILQARTIEQAMVLARKAQEILWEEQPFIPLFVNYFPFLFRNDCFKGWVFSPGQGIINYWSFLNVTPTNADVEGDEIKRDIVHVGVTRSLARLSDMFSLHGLFSDCFNGYPCFNALSLIFDTLWKKDPQTGEIIPWLADYWETEIVHNDTLEPFTGDVNSANISELARRVTFHLNDQFRWHDGLPVLPEDVAFTYQFIQNHEPSLWSTLTKNGGGSINPRRITFNNVNMTVTIILESLSYLSFQDTGAFILPKHIFQPLLDPETRKNFSLLYNHPKIGSGPYTWDYQANDSTIILERNPKWYFGTSITLKETPSHAPSTVDELDSISEIFEMRVSGFEGWSFLALVISFPSFVTVVRRKEQKRNLKILISRIHPRNDSLPHFRG